MAVTEPEEIQIQAQPEAEPETVETTETEYAAFALPANWEQIDDPTSGSMYFFNAVTGESSWDRLTTGAAAAADAADINGFTEYCC